MRSRPADKDDRKKSNLFDMMCQACVHHLVTQNISKVRLTPD